MPSANSSTYGANLTHVINSINGNPAPTTLAAFQRPAELMLITDSEDSKSAALTGKGCSSFQAGFVGLYHPVEQAALSTTCARYLVTTGGVERSPQRWGECPVPRQPRQMAAPSAIIAFELTKTTPSISGAIGRAQGSHT